MEREPRKLPDYGAEIHNFKWYCYHCEQWRNDANSLLVHLGATHDITAPSRGEDYDSGSFVQLAMHERGFWERKQARLFAAHLDTLGGADDVTWWIGDGAPVEKWGEK